MTYYKEKQRALQEADHIINEVLYVQEQGINLNSLEKIQAPRFQCNFMKVFHQRLAIYMESDSSIKIVDNVITAGKGNAK